MHFLLVFHRVQTSTIDGVRACKGLFFRYYQNLAINIHIFVPTNLIIETWIIKQWHFSVTSISISRNNFLCRHGVIVSHFSSCYLCNWVCVNFCPSLLPPFYLFLHTKFSCCFSSSTFYNYLLIQAIIKYFLMRTLNTLLLGLSIKLLAKLTQFSFTLFNMIILYFFCFWRCSYYFHNSEVVIMCMPTKCSKQTEIYPVFLRISVGVGPISFPKSR